MRVPRQAVSLISALDFMKMAMPKKFGDAPLFLCPAEFSQMMQLRTEKLAELQQKQPKGPHNQWQGSLILRQVWARY